MGSGLKTLVRRVTSIPMGRTVLVVGLQRDPRRTAPVALVMDVETSAMHMVLAGEGMNVGDRIRSPQMTSSSTSSSTSSFRGTEDSLGGDRRDAEILPNTRCRRAWRPVGTTVYDLSVQRGTPRSSIDSTPSTMVKTAGSFAVIVNHRQGTRDRVAVPSVLGSAPGREAPLVHRTRIRLPSGEERRVPEDSCATVGRVSGEDHRLEVRGKAGIPRRRGVRPTVRGCAMNPIDHPHGGRTKGGRHDVTPWAKIAKGRPTRPDRLRASHRVAVLVKSVRGKVFTSNEAGSSRGSSRGS